MQFGAYTFIETRRDPVTGEPIDVDKAFTNVLEQIELADRVGLDVFGSVNIIGRIMRCLKCPAWAKR
jgi:hypothetical protein